MTIESGVFFAKFPLDSIGFMMHFEVGSSGHSLHAKIGAFDRAIEGNSSSTISEFETCRIILL